MYVKESKRVQLNTTTQCSLYSLFDIVRLHVDEMMEVRAVADFEVIPAVLEIVANLISMLI